MHHSLIHLWIEKLCVSKKQMQNEDIETIASWQNMS